MKNKGPKPFKGDEGTLEKILFQMDEYFHPYKYVADDDKLATLALYLEGSVLDWWRQKKPSFTKWEEAKKALVDQYGDNFVQDNARRDLEELQQRLR